MAVNARPTAAKREREKSAERAPQRRKEGACVARERAKRPAPPDPTSDRPTSRISAWSSLFADWQIDEDPSIVLAASVPSGAVFLSTHLFSRAHVRSARQAHWGAPPPPPPGPPCALP